MTVKERSQRLEAIGDDCGKKAEPARGERRRPSCPLSIVKELGRLAQRKAGRTRCWIAGVWKMEHRGTTRRASLKLERSTEIA